MKKFKTLLLVPQKRLLETGIKSIFDLNNF